MGRPPLVGVDVGESGLGDGWGFAVAEGPSEPYGHLPAREGLVGADEPVAAFGAVQVAPGGERVEARLVHTAVVVAECAGIVVLCGCGRREHGHNERERRQGSSRAASAQPTAHGSLRGRGHGFSLC